MENQVKIHLIAAVDRNGGIGRDNQLLMSHREDMQFFKAHTWGGCVVMGRKTWESIGEKPLPGRMNIVISSDPEKKSNTPFMTYVVDEHEALDMAAQFGFNAVWIIGGGEVYKTFIRYADSILLTEMTAVFPDKQVDTYFPHFDKEAFTVLMRLKAATFPGRFVWYHRRRK